MTRFYIVPVEDEERNLDTRFVGQIRSFPELVHCKDCKHYFEDAFREDEWVICRRTNLYIDGDKYCAWAERKEE